jgi:C-terminal processing protease CtpA/Prc
MTTTGNFWESARHPIWNRSSSASEHSKALAGGGGGGLGQTVFADDSSFEEQFGFAEHRYSVEVPPGKLGMVIDTPNGGAPIVHAIKSESVLCDAVGVGDQLVSVDEQDVTNLNAVQVSKLICAKSDRQRSLVFVRARGRFDSADLVLEEGAC